MKTLRPIIGRTKSNKTTALLGDGKDDYMFCQQCGKRLEGKFCRQCRLDWQRADYVPAEAICSIQDLVGKTWDGGGYPGEAYYRMRFVEMLGEKILASVKVDFPYGGHDTGFAVVTCDGFGYEHRYFNTQADAKAAVETNGAG